MKSCARLEYPSLSNVEESVVFQIDEINYLNQFGERRCQISIFMEASE